MTNKSSLLLFSLVLLCASFVQSQNTVVLAPIPQFVSYTQYGVPNAFGCVFTYAVNTTSQLVTYTDVSGATANQNPVVLSAGGTANIWLLAGSSYSFQVKTAGGINCASGSTLYTVNGIGNGGSTQTTVVPYSATPYFPVTSQNQLFTLTLSGNAVALPITVSGVTPPSYITFQITQDVAGAHTFTWPANVVGGAPVGSTPNQVTTQEFVWNGTNATAVGLANVGAGNVSALGNYLSPSLQTPIVNGAQIVNSPGTYYVGAGTGVVGQLVSLISGSFGNILLTPAAATGGIIGVDVAGVSTPVTVQQSGESTCTFDGAATAPDYVQISPTVAGNCHDAGPNYPGSGQVLGRVLSNISAAGSTGIDLFGPEIQSGGNLVYTASGTLVAPAHTVIAGVALPGSGPGFITISGAAIFTSTSICVGTDNQGPNPVQVKTFGGLNTLEVFGTAGDGVGVICVGH